MKKKQFSKLKVRVRTLISHFLSVIEKSSSYNSSLKDLDLVKSIYFEELDKISESLEELLSKIKECMANRSDIKKLFQLIRSITIESFLKRYPMMFDTIHNCFGKVAFYHRDYEFSIFLHDQIKYYAMLEIQKRGLMESYYGIAKSHSKLSNFTEAIRNAKRALEISFRLRD